MGVPQLPAVMGGLISNLHDIEVVGLGAEIRSLFLAPGGGAGETIGYASQIGDFTFAQQGYEGHIRLLLPYLYDIWNKEYKGSGKRNDVYASTVDSPTEISFGPDIGMESVLLKTITLPSTISETFGFADIIYGGKCQFRYGNSWGPLKFINSSNQRLWPDADGADGINIVPKPGMILQLYVTSTTVTEHPYVLIGGKQQSPAKGKLDTVDGIHWF